MHVVLAEPAERDLVSIIDYIAHDNPRAAEKAYRTIATSLRRLADFPKMGRPGRLPGTRELRVSALPYLVAYQVTGDRVTILAIFHTARDLVKALDERQHDLKK
jgi:toxin ParE1/3/4